MNLDELQERILANGDGWAALIETTARAIWEDAMRAGHLPVVGTPLSRIVVGVSAEEVTISYGDGPVFFSDPGRIGQRVRGRVIFRERMIVVGSWIGEMVVRVRRIPESRVPLLKHEFRHCLAMVGMGCERNEWPPE